MGNFSNLPPKIPLTRKGDFSLLKNLELTYSTRALRSIRFTLIVLVALMILVAAISTAFMAANNELNMKNPQGITQVICLWLFPLIIYAYFSWLYLLRSRYRIVITMDGISYQRGRNRDFITHQEIETALETKPVLRNRIGVWLPTRGKMRILLSEMDTLPGRPFIEDLLAYYNMPMPRDPYGTDRMTFSSMGLAMLFIVCPFFIWSGYINTNPNALRYSLYIAAGVAVVGIVLLLMSNHTTSAYKNDPEYNEDDDGDDELDDYDDLPADDGGTEDDLKENGK